MPLWGVNALRLCNTEEEAACSVRRQRNYISIRDHNLVVPDHAAESPQVVPNTLPHFGGSSHDRDCYRLFLQRIPHSQASRQRRIPSQGLDWLGVGQHRHECTRPWQSHTWRGPHNMLRPPPHTCLRTCSPACSHPDTSTSASFGFGFGASASARTRSQTRTLQSTRVQVGALAWCIIARVSPMNQGPLGPV